MKQLQQFNVLSITNQRLLRSGLDLQITLREAIRNDEIIQIADNEVLRAIRRITNHPFTQEKADDLWKSRDIITKQKSGAKNKRLIKEITDSLDNILYIPEYVCLTTDDKRRFTKIGKNGFKINGEPYVRLLCGAGHSRTNRTMFVKKSIYKELNDILRNGCKNVEIIWQKYNAYYALASSATFRVREPRVCVVPDKEIKMIKRVDWTTETKDDDVINLQDKELSFNLWDGMGIISPDFASLWAEDLDLDYLPSAFILRSAFIKGLVAVFDFKTFAREIAKKNIIKDIYGDTYTIDDIDVILTQSQFKLWNAYDSWQHYLDCLKKSQISWGVSKCTPKVEKDYIRTNYQFLQVLNLTDDDIKELCKPTLEWIKGISGGNVNDMTFYLLGKLAKEPSHEKLWNNIQDNFIRALLLENRLIDDTYIRARIINSLNKRIKESYIGKILVGGNFQMMIADPYAFCEYIFGMEIKGLLKEFEHHSGYWNKLGKNKVAGMRAPLTWRSEVNLLNLQHNDMTKEWYKYLDHCIIYNVWGLDMAIHAGADFDGDVVMTTANPQILKGRYGGVPVLYEPKKADKIKLDESQLYKVDPLAYNTKIGMITNVSTTYYELLEKFPEGSKEREEIINRLKLCCVFQSREIDRAKGIKVKSFPKHWQKFKSASSLREKLYKEYDIENLQGKEKDYALADIDDKVKEQEFNNSLICEKRTYFMRHRYYAYNTKYKKFKTDFERYCAIVFNKSLSDVLSSSDEQYDDFKKYYNFKNPLIETKGVMNRICCYMESQLKDISKNIKDKNDETYNLLFNKDIPFDQDKLKLMLKIYEKYNNFKNNHRLQESEFNTYEQYFKHLRHTALTEVTTSMTECANYAVYICYKLYPRRAKDFAWDCFGKGIVNFLKGSGKNILLPTLDENGDTSYLYQKFKMEEFYVE